MVYIPAEIIRLSRLANDMAREGGDVQDILLNISNLRCYMQRGFSYLPDENGNMRSAT